MTRAPDDLLASAAGDLDEGRPEEALAKLTDYQADPDALLLLAEALLALGEHGPAHLAFEEACSELDPEDPDVVWVRAELALGEWKLEAAATDLEAHTQAVPSIPGHMRLALAYDALGRSADADEQFSRCQSLAAELGEELPHTRLSEAEFDAIVEAGLDQQRSRHAAEVQQVRIVTEPMPWSGLVEGDEVHATPPDLLGLFVGPTVHELAEGASGELPPTIYLFQRNLERLGLERQELEKEIQTTLYHEFGHLLGLDEDGVAALGLA